MTTNETQTFDAADVDAINALLRPSEPRVTLGELCSLPPSKRGAKGWVAALRRMRNPPQPKYRAEMGGASWARGPVAHFPTIREARAWAEEYGTTADYCVIRDGKGRVVAEHRRNPNSPGGWYRAHI